MNISLNQLSETDGLITLKLDESDYQAKVTTKLKGYAKKATIKGFRQGMVPASVVKKMYGRSVLVEEVNHIISHSLNDYIKEKKLKVLGNPIPDNENQAPIDWDFQKNFEFVFQIGMAADFKVDLSPSVKIQKFKIEVGEDVIQTTLEETRMRYGGTINPETSEVKDVLYGEILGVEDEAKKNSYVIIEKVKKEEQQKFLGVKKDDVIEFDAKQAFEDVVDQSAALGISEGELVESDGKISVKINFINRTMPAELNQELFDKVFGKDVVTTEEDFLNKVKETIAGNYDREADHLLEHEIEHHLMDTTTINLPDEFLKKWLKATGGEITDEVLDKEFNDYKKSIKMDLIINQVAEENKIVVGTKEVQDYARGLIMTQFGGPRVAEQLGAQLGGFVESYLQGNEGKNFMKIYNTIRHQKIVAGVKSLITVVEKGVSLEEFKTHVEAHRH